MERRRIALVNPSRLNRISRRTGITNEPHLGLAYIAAALRNEGYDVRFIDAETMGYSIEKTVTLAEEGDPLFIGLTGDTTMIKSGGKLADALKNNNAERTVVVGGYHATVMPSDTLRQFTSFDVAVIGEGERTAVELAEALSGRRVLREVAGIAYRDGKKIVMNQLRPPNHNLDALPFPAWDLMPLLHYRAHYRPGEGIIELPVNTGRGCHGRCKFCARVSGSDVRRRSASSVMEEIRLDVSKFSARAIVFNDETFTAEPELVVDLCETIISEGLNRKMYWLCMTRVDSVTPQLLSLMAKAGCRYIAFGVDSGNPELLDYASKGTTPGQIIDAVRSARKAGMQVDSFFILGLPGETQRTINKTVDFAIELAPDFANFFILVPYPGTKVYEMAKRGEAGLRLLTEDWDMYGIQMGKALELEGLPRAELESAQLKAYLRFYLRPDKIGNMFRMVNFRVLPTYLKSMVVGQVEKLIARRGADEKF